MFLILFESILFNQKKDELITNQLLKVVLKEKKLKMFFVVIYFTFIYIYFYALRRRRRKSNKNKQPINLCLLIKLFLTNQISIFIYILLSYALRFLALFFERKTKRKKQQIFYKLLYFGFYLKLK